MVKNAFKGEEWLFLKGLLTFGYFWKQIKKEVS